MISIPSSLSTFQRTSLNTCQQIDLTKVTCRVSGKSSAVPKDFAVRIVSSDTFDPIDMQLNMKGRIHTEHGQMIQSLLDEADLELYAVYNADENNVSTRQDRVFQERSGSLKITIYGPFDLLDEIGSYFQEYGVYLQDPMNADKPHARYCNPHRLSVDYFQSSVLVSDIISIRSNIGEIEEIADRPDFLDVLSTRADLAESPQPTAIRTELKRSSNNLSAFYNSILT